MTIRHKQGSSHFAGNCFAFTLERDEPLKSPLPLLAVGFAPAAQHPAIRAEEHQPIMVDQVAVGGIQHVRDPLGIFHVRAGHSGGGQLAELDALAFP